MIKDPLLVAKSPYTVKTVGTHGFKYKESYTVCVDSATKTPGVLVKRITEFPNIGVAAEYGYGECIKKYRDKVYVLTITAFNLNNFLKASEHIFEQLEIITEHLKNIGND